MLPLPAVAYFDFHHHHTDGRTGIYNLPAAGARGNESFSVGLHPREIAEDWQEKFIHIAETACHPQCRAIGECGFDARSPADEALQKMVFQQHLILAEELRKPVIVHCVRRFDWLMSFSGKNLPPMVVHGFSKNEQMGRELLRKGFGLSLGGALLHTPQLHRLLAENGLPGIFFETDERPLGVEEIYRCAAEILHMDLTEIQQKIQQNLNNLWNGTEMAGAQ